MCYVSHSRNTRIFSRPFAPPVRARLSLSLIIALLRQELVPTAALASVARAPPWISVIFGCLVRVAASRTTEGEHPLSNAHNLWQLLFVWKLLKNKPLHFCSTTHYPTFTLGECNCLPSSSSFLPTFLMVLWGELGGRQWHQGQQAVRSHVDSSLNQK